MLTGSGPRFEATHAVRKSGGVYYTPGYVVDYIVEETVGKIVAGKSPREMRGVRVLDPACGTGRFLLRVYERMTEENRRWLEAHPDGTQDTEPSDILANCIFGIDIDELAVEITRLSLYLEAMEGEASDQGVRRVRTARMSQLDGNCNASEVSSAAKAAAEHKTLNAALKRCSTHNQTPVRLSSQSPKPRTFKTIHEIASVLTANVQCGNSLRPQRTARFDVVLGNPPYGAEMSAVVRAELAKQFDAGTTETAALMMLHASRNLTRPGGVNGFIVPKAFTYSSNWRKVRAELLGEMTALVDVGKVWPEVRLEQVIYFLQKGSRRESYANLRRDGEQFEDVGLIEKQHCQGFGFLLNGISREELEVGLKIKSAGSFLGEYVSNTRGAMFQEHVSTRKRGRRVIGGKQIQRFQIVGEKGFVSSTASIEKNAFVAPESILVQNIIAHIENPIDHIKITGAVVDDKIAREIVILDTVNQLANRSTLSPYYFLAILNSRLMNWYVYRFIYAKAIRTMHFDGPVTSRIPVPRITSSNRQLYEEIVSGAKERCRKEALDSSHAIEGAIYRLYGLSNSDVAVIESGMPGGTGHSVEKSRSADLSG